MVKHQNYGVITMGMTTRARFYKLVIRLLLKIYRSAYEIPPWQADRLTRECESFIDELGG